MCVSLRFSETSPCYTRKAPMCVFVAFRVDSGVSSEDSAETDGDVRVLCEQHFVCDGLFLVSMTGKSVTLCCD